MDPFLFIQKLEADKSRTGPILLNPIVFLGCFREVVD